MSDAIEVLKKFVKDCNECCVDDVPYRQPVEDAINKAILALEQKEKVDRFVIKVFNRLKERAEFDRARAETDLKILEKWRKDYLELVK